MNERMNRNFTRAEGVSLKEHLERIIDLKFDSIEKETNEARRLMEKNMAGFPAEYAKKLELEQTAGLVKELKDKDFREIKDTIDLKLGVIEYNQRHESLDKEIGRIARDLSNIQGRIIGTGGVVMFVVIVVQVLIHVFWGKQ
jgi:hypothetical protein